MIEMDRIRRTVATWTERKLQRAEKAGLSAAEASLAIMDSFEWRFNLVSERDLWVSEDFEEWCMSLKLLNGWAFFVNDQTLAALIRGRPG